MVRKVYSHLGYVRHRVEVVEYRVEQHRAKLDDRVRALCGIQILAPQWHHEDGAPA